ncbi:alanine--tRNA ligase [Acidimicrobiaceae bacterium]|nr:alanine--tRNA ligase [Acidimicrobiaceae bacterium]
MNSNEIREEFLKFFEQNNHKIMPSASLIPIDETLLFTAAGMVPFKDYFLGNNKPPHVNLVSSQKCIRTVDIDIIGDTDRHLTFFEMLGNFSIGEYFKEQAIKHAYEFITKNLEINPDDLWFTVYKDDDESFNIWKDVIGVPEEKIQRGDKDNFWQMNIPGPCGPCSEIFIDRGPDYGEDGGPIGGGEDRFIEIWNLVFMESIQDEPYNVVGELPAKNIDTGMGLERIAMVLQDKESPFEIDTFESIYEQLKPKIKTPNKKYERIILDHMKASTFMISDGVVPTNEGRGYILRRLIRRAIRAYYGLTNEIDSIEFLISPIVEIYKDHYPDLYKNIDKIKKLYTTEENLFHKTLEKGTVEINRLIQDKETFDEEKAFYLFETFGFPYELTKEIAFENNIQLNDDKYMKKFQEHQAKSSAFKKETSNISEFDVDCNVFTGYENTNTISEVTLVLNENGTTTIFTEATPFYYEAGGQISDQGSIVFEDKEYTVADVVQSSSGATGLVIKEDIGIQSGGKIESKVNESFRRSVSKSHTSAHIVHSSLRNILGDHVAQAGSYVAPGRFRFDFSHSEKVTQEELNEIFTLSNKNVFSDLKVDTKIMNIDEAKKEGALAFFGDKYDDDVRVVNIGNFSKELCGGTHVSNSNEIGLIVLLNESSIGSNLRRVEMLSGFEAYDFMTNAYNSYKSVSNLLNTNIENVPTKLESFFNSYEELKSQVDQFKQIRNNEMVEQISNKSENVGDYKVFINQVSMDTVDDIRNVAINSINNGVVDYIYLISQIESKFVIVAMKNEKVIKDMNVSELVIETSKNFGGGASKDQVLSVGGGPNDYSIDETLKYVKESIVNNLK